MLIFDMLIFFYLYHLCYICNIKKNIKDINNETIQFISNYEKCSSYI